MKVLTPFWTIGGALAIESNNKIFKKNYW